MDGWSDHKKIRQGASQKCAYQRRTFLKDAFLLHKKFARRSNHTEYLLIVLSVAMTTHYSNGDVLIAITKDLNLGWSQTVLSFLALLLESYFYDFNEIWLSAILLFWSRFQAKRKANYNGFKKFLFIFFELSFRISAKLNRNFETTQVGRDLN